MNMYAKKTKSHRKYSRTRKHHCKHPAIIYIDNTNCIKICLKN